MADRFIEPDYTIDAPPAKGTLFDIALVLVILLTTFFSAYTTYKGFSYDIPHVLAGFLSVVIGLSLLAINLKIRDLRREGRSLLRAFIMFFVVFIFSFISNTNAVYTYFVQRDIVGQTQENAWQIFDAETKRIAADIRKQPEVMQQQAWQDALDSARRNLRQQITDPRNPGFGELAKVHYRDITRLLGINLTPLRPPPANSSMSQYQTYAEELDSLIGKQAQNPSRSNEAQTLLETLRKIDTLREFYGKKMLEKQYHRNTTDLMKRDLLSIEASVASVLTLAPPIRSIDNAADETGSFRYTWRNILHWVSPAAIVLAVLLGALLDLLAPLMSVLLYRPNEDL